MAASSSLPANLARRLANALAGSGGHAMLPGRRRTARRDFRASLAQELAQLDRPALIMQSACEHLGRHLGLDLVSFYEITGEAFVIEREWRTDRAPSMIGSHPVEAFGSRAQRLREHGDVARVNDASEEEDAVLLAQMGIGAIVSVPLYRGDRWSAGLHIHQAEPRRWTNEEISLVREVAEGTWAAMEQARAEAMLRERDERLQLAIDAAELGTWELDLVNDDASLRSARHDRIFGYDSVQPVWGRAISEQHILPEDLPIYRTAFAQALKSGLLSCEVRVGWPDGSVHWIRPQGRTRYDAAGRPIHMSGVVADITAQKTLELELQAVNAALESSVSLRTAERDQLWEHSVDLLVIANYEGRFLRVSPSWTRLLGFSPTRLLDLDYREILHPHDAALIERHLADLSTNGQPLKCEIRLRDEDGSWHWVAWTLVPEPGAQLVTGVGRDVTADRAQQAELAAARETLRQAQKMDAVGQLTGGIAHDFNNLLACISGNLELLRMRLARGQTDDLERHVVIAQDASGRAASLTKRLLAFARRQPLDPTPTNIHQLVRGMEDLIRRIAGPEITLHVEPGEDVWITLIDTNQLENALLNLCINARDAMPNGGRLTVSTKNVAVERRRARDLGIEAGDYVVLCVSDEGTGMSEAVMQRAFEPFFTTKAAGLGTGLGLSIIYGFARQSNGWATISSVVGEGTSICLYLPRHIGSELQPAGDAAAPAAPRRGAGETILVVDDEPTMRQMITEVLEDLGYGVLTAPDGVAALALIDSPARIDLLITDLRMPGPIPGDRLAADARRLRRSIGVLFITGCTAEDGMLKCGDRVLTKPFAIATLAAEVKDMLPAV